MRFIKALLGGAFLLGLLLTCTAVFLTATVLLGMFHVIPAPLRPLFIAWLYGEIPPGSDPDAPSALGVYNRVPCEGHQMPATFYCGRLVAEAPPQGTFYVTDCFGTIRQGGYRHAGIDFGAYNDSTVLTPWGGVVTWAGPNGPYGVLVVIENQGVQVWLAHNRAPLVSPGDVVQAGDPVAISDNTGVSTGPHVHLEVRECGEGNLVTAVNPATYTFPDGSTCNFLAVADYISNSAPAHCRP